MKFASIIALVLPAAALAQVCAQTNYLEQNINLDDRYLPQPSATLQRLLDPQICQSPKNRLVLTPTIVPGVNKTKKRMKIRKRTKNFEGSGLRSPEISLAVNGIIIALTPAKLTNFHPFLYFVGFKLMVHRT